MKNHKQLIRMHHSLILLPHNFVSTQFCCHTILLTRNIDFRYIFHAKKALVDPTDSTCPESTPDECGKYGVIDIIVKYLRCRRVEKMEYFKLLEMRYGDTKWSQ